MSGIRRRSRGARDRALLLIGFAGASAFELVAIDVEHVQSTSTGIRLMIPRSKTDPSGAGAEIGIMSGADEAACPVPALRCAPGSSWRKSLIARCSVASPTPELSVRGGCTRTRSARFCARRAAAAAGRLFAALPCARMTGRPSPCESPVQPPPNRENGSPQLLRPSPAIVWRRISAPTDHPCPQTVLSRLAPRAACHAA